MNVSRITTAATLAWLLLGMGSLRSAVAQSGSLYGEPDARRPLTLANASWIYQPPKEPKVYKLHDLITVIVDEKAQVISEGEVDRKKKANGTIALNDWIILKGLKKVIPAPMSNGDPTMSGSVDNKFKTDSSIETREALKFQIATEVVDIRPNGTLVLNGMRMIQVNEEVWEVSLGGIVRPEDVLPNNTVLSQNLAEPRIVKREKGHVVDGYRRGWLQQWLDHYQPF